MTDTNQHITGGDPIEGADPGGARSTKPGNKDKAGAAGKEPVDQAVKSGDRNDKAGGP